MPITKPFWQSKTFWFAVSTVAVLIVGGIFQMHATAVPHWLSLLVGGIATVFIVVEKILAAKTLDSRVLSGNPAQALMYVGLGLTALWGYLKSVGIEIPAETIASVDTVIAAFTVGDRMKTAALNNYSNDPTKLSQ